MTQKTDKPTSSKEEGIIYVSSTGATWTSDSSAKDKPSAQKLKRLSENIYGAGISEKQRRLLFSRTYRIEVRDEKGEPSPDLETKMTRMCDASKVDLWSSMQVTFHDVFWFGPSLLNPVWVYGDGGEYAVNEYYLKALRRLPPETFSTSPNNATEIYSEILKGIIVNDKGEIEYYQTDPVTGNTTQIKNIFAIKEPTSTDIAGTPMILPVTPVITMLDYTWVAQMQKVNRTGSPLLFLRIDTNHPRSQKDDVDYGKQVVQNWGKNTAFTLRPNMELISPNISDTADNLETIAALNAMVTDYFSPAKFISKDGTLIGGSSAGELELMQSYIAGMSAWVASAYSRLLDKYLVANGYEGYSVKVVIENLSIDRSEIELEAVNVGIEKGLISKEEGRKYLPLELDPLDDKKRQEILDEQISMTYPAFPTIATDTPQEKTPDADDESVEDAEDNEQKNQDHFPGTGNMVHTNTAKKPKTMDEIFDEERDAVMKLLYDVLGE